MNNPFAKVRVFFNETLQELKRSTWPTRKELRNSTLVVVAAIGILSVYVAVVDFSLLSLVNLLTRFFRFS